MRQIFKYWLDHPLARKRLGKTILNFIWWQIASRMRSSIDVKFASHSKLRVRRGMTGATGNIYCGLHEFNDMGFLLHAMRSTDLFLDVGANIGSYSILASSEIGCKSHGFEPLPSTFKSLEENVLLNGVEGRCQLHNNGVGSSPGMLKFTSDRDTVNHVATRGEAGIQVPVITLDSLMINCKEIFLKIDVEGFESEVIQGGHQLINKPHQILGLVIELNGSGRRYGKEDIDIHQTLLEAGYASYLYSPFERVLQPIDTPSNHNTIYIPNNRLAEIQERLKNGPVWKIHGTSF
jgi:FkbM family methyltransferase